MRMNQLIKQLAEEERKESKPVELVTGKVISVSPLQINADGISLPLTEEFLILTHLVRDYQVLFTVNHQTEDAALTENAFTDYQSHHHAYQGKKVFTVHQGLKMGEAVLLLRLQGGQKYVVLDRVAGDIL